MEKHALHVGIIGGGIGGLAAASALQRQGIGVTVFERNPELREIGAGLTLWANGVQVLRHLGLADALTTVSARLTHFECWSWRGKRLGSMRLDTIERRVGAPSLGIHRADLLRRLSGAVDRGSIHLYAHCVGFRSEQGHVISHFADGHELQTDLLVGADGLHSVIREQLLGKQPPRYSGYTCWRGVALFEDAHVSPGISSETWGRGRRFGMLPIGNGRVFWYATLNCPVGEQDRTGERKARLSRLFEGWREPIGHPIVTVAERDPCSALASGGAFPLKRSPRFARSSSSGFGARLQLDLIAQPFQQTRCCSLPLMRHPISRRPKSSSTAVPQGHHLALPVIVNRHPVRGRQASSITGGKTDPPVNTTHQYTGWAVIQGESYSVKRGRRE